MTQAFNLSQFANNLNSSGATSNSGLQNSSVTVVAGTGMSGGGAVALGASVTLTNAGVTSIVAGTGISISGATGAVTVTNSITNAYTGQSGQLFTSSGTFSVPTGVTKVKVTLCGGGGGGQVLGAGGNNYVSGGGGTSTFSTISATGGSGSNSGVHSNGSGSGGSFNATTPVVIGLAGYSGSPPLGDGFGGYGVYADSGDRTWQLAGGNGGGSFGWLTVSSGGSVSVTVGAAGSASSAEGYAGDNGVAGAVLIEW